MVASIGVIASASQGVSYYEKDGYYAKDDPAHSEASAWAGKGAEELGLTGHAWLDRGDEAPRGTSQRGAEGRGEADPLVEGPGVGGAGIRRYAELDITALMPRS